MPAQTASFGPLHISMQIRLYLHPVYPGFTTSGGFSLLPFGIVVEPFLNPFPMIPIGHWSFSSRASPYVAGKAFYPVAVFESGIVYSFSRFKAAPENLSCFFTQNTNRFVMWFCPPVFFCVDRVFSICHPFKVFHPVIKSVSVLVINLRKIIRVWNKRFRD